MVVCFPENNRRELNKSLFVGGICIENKLACKVSILIYIYFIKLDFIAICTKVALKKDRKVCV